jgi:hypothetical protein
VTEETRCPVCSDEFGNPGALGTHLSLTKDTAHVAHRAQAEGDAPASPEATPAPFALPPALAEPLLRLASGEAPPREAALSEAGEAPRQGEAGEADAQVFLLPSPLNVEPLLPPGEAPGQAGAPKAPPVSVPLEPILSGALAIGLTGLVLNKPGDRELTSEMVQGTGFPKSVEACLRLYFPDLPLDHPIVALIASCTGLGMLVLQLKAKAPTEPEAPAQATPQATVQAAPDQAPAPASTGDAYWDSILRQAGGVQA